MFIVYAYNVHYNNVLYMYDTFHTYKARAYVRREVLMFIGKLGTCARLEQ
jgi:hypothetical protein